jgi:hypothetical protein
MATELARPASRKTTPAVQRAMGITVHTGWGACVVVGGSLERPEIIANVVIEILGNDERFCFHAASEMKPAAARTSIEHPRDKALNAARRALVPLIAHGVGACAIVARQGKATDLSEALSSHPRIHTGEGCFYRDVFGEACSVPVHVIPPSLLDASRVGKLVPPPWGRDQKLAALAAWSLLEK